jgi:mRNA interferase RelE/StbE
MAKYEATFRQSVLKDVNRIPRKDVQRILAAVRALSDNPRPPQSLKLSGEEKYRLRCGAYRVIYSIEDERLVICVVKVGHRKDVYRR